MTGPITITDSGKGTVTTVEGKGYADRVIWSPFGNEAMGYDKFVCVEPVSASPVTIPVGKFKETKVRLLNVSIVELVPNFCFLIYSSTKRFLAPRSNWTLFQQLCIFYSLGVLHLQLIYQQKNCNF